MAPARQNIKVALARMLRCVITLTGTVAVSGIKIWTVAKASNSTPKKTISRITRQLFQG